VRVDPEQILFSQSLQRSGDVEDHVAAGQRRRQARRLSYIPAYHLYVDTVKIPKVARWAGEDSNTIPLRHEACTQVRADESLSASYQSAHASARRQRT
jgi:hypothetical protein